MVAEYAAAAQTTVRDEACFADFLETVLKAESDFRHKNASKPKGV